MSSIRWAGFVLLVSGCAGLAAAPSSPIAVARRAPAPVSVRFTSSVPDRYAVLAGPAESYRRIDVNARLKALLDNYAQVKSGPTKGAPVEVLVHLESITTGYERIGAISPTRTRLALGPSRAASDAQPLLAQEGEPFEDSRPYQITKTVDVNLAAEVRRSGLAPLKKDLTAKRTEVVERRDIDRWAYDYGALVDEALREAVRQLDAFVDEAAGAEGG